jgi:hypothetical protein
VVVEVVAAREVQRAPTRTTSISNSEVLMLLLLLLLLLLMPGI